MPRYIILPNTTDKTDGENISTYIFQLSRPQTPGTTKRHCGVIQHPTDGRVALVWPDSDDTTVALIQSTERKNNVLDAIEAEYGTTARNTVDDVISNNTTLDLTNYFSTTDRATMEADGWFPDINL